MHDPCGTPARVGLQLNRIQFCRTLKDIPLMQEKIILQMLTGMPIRCNFCSRPLCHTRAKTPSLYLKIPRLFILCCYNYRSESLTNCRVVECSDQKANCSWHILEPIALLGFFLRIIRSRIFDNEEHKEIGRQVVYRIAVAFGLRKAIITAIIQTFGKQPMRMQPLNRWIRNMMTFLGRCLRAEFDT